jgi:hypothetical protein
VYYDRLGARVGIYVATEDVRVADNVIVEEGHELSLGQGNSRIPRFT